MECPPISEEKKWRKSRGGVRERGGGVGTGKMGGRGNRLGYKNKKKLSPAFRHLFSIFLSLKLKHKTHRFL